MFTDPRCHSYQRQRYGCCGRAQEFYYRWGGYITKRNAAQTNPSQRLMLSASNMPVPSHSYDIPEDQHPTQCILLPAFLSITNVTPTTVPTLITQVINSSHTNSSPVSHPPPLSLPSDSPFHITPCPHDYLILLCSHKTRDARCGQSAPLLRREFERHLRPLGLMRDLHDERPGGVGIYFINHVGGHKFSANVLIYRRAGMPGAEGPPRVVNIPAGNEVEKIDQEGEDGPAEAGQCIWLARVRPEDCENIIRYTVLQGKVVKPERQLRGGFDRCKQLVSW
jgi:Sucrase/ferredoxin-like